VRRAALSPKNAPSARDDGVIYSLQGVGHNFELPHEVMHFVVESALRLPTGF
jgi:hypothetical protein